jgi:hypothetical protein
MVSCDARAYGHKGNPLDEITLDRLGEIYAEGPRFQ